MKITVEEVCQHGEASCEIRFSSSAGHGRARWASEEPPVEGKMYDAELDIEDVVSVGVNAERSRSGEFELSATDGFVMLRGKIESKDDDGMVYLRLAPDCLVMVESEGGLIWSGEWLAIAVPIGAVSVSAQGF